MNKKLILEEPVDNIEKTVIVEDIVDDDTVTEIEKEISDIDTDLLDGGIASLLNADIIDEFEAIDAYNSHIVTLKDLMTKTTDEEKIRTYQNIIDILTDIANEENIHVGQLQKALNLVSASASFIKKGEIEAEEVVEE